MAYSYWQGVIFRAAVVILVIYLAFYVIDYTLPLLYPFLIGWIIAMSMEPMVRALEKKAKLPRWISVTVILLLLIALVFTLVIFVITEIVVELTELAKFLPQFFKQVQQFFVELFTQDNNNVKRLVETLQSYLQKNPEQEKQISDSIRENIGIVANKGTALITDFLTWIGQFLSDLPFFLTVLIFILLAAFFIGLDWPKQQKFMQSLIPTKIHRTGGLIIQDIKKAMLGFVRAQLMLISITAVIMLIGLLILQVNYAVTIALVIGFVDLLPYLGVGAVLVPWILYLLFLGDFQLAIGLSIVYGIIIVIRQILEPRLLASTVGLDPLLTLISIFVGLNLFGFLGIIIGPVTIVILLALYRAGVFTDIVAFIKGKPPTPRVETK